MPEKLSIAMIVLPKANVPPINQVQLREIFKRYDTNGDGRLDREELANAFRSLGSRCPRWRAARSLFHADRNGDGFIDQDEIDELEKYALKWIHKSRPELRTNYGRRRLRCVCLCY